MKRQPRTDEQAHESRLPQRTYAVIRVDGHNFKRFTRQFERPFSEPFAGAMDAVGEALLGFFGGSLFTYVQSDEASVVLTDLTGEDAQLPHGGRVVKIASLAAGVATAGFKAALPTCEGYPVFDARVFPLATLPEVYQYVRDRRSDAKRNAVTMAAQSMYPESVLHGMHSNDRAALLEARGFEMPEPFFHGRLLYREQFEQAAGGLRTRVVTETADMAHLDAFFATLA